MEVSKRQAWLVLKAQSGDHTALDQLLKGIQAQLFACIRGITTEDALAEDVLQDVFVTICTKLGHLRDPTAFGAWSLRIATREALRRVTRKRRWEGRMVGDEALSTVPADAPVWEPDPLLRQRLGDALASVSPASRAVLTLHYIAGLSVRGCADVLDIAVGTAKSRLAYGLETLRKEMADDHRSELGRSTPRRTGHG